MAEQGGQIVTEGGSPIVELNAATIKKHAEALARAAKNMAKTLREFLMIFGLSLSTPMRAVVEGMTVEQRPEGMTVEQRPEGMTVEQRAEIEVRFQENMARYPDVTWCESSKASNDSSTIEQRAEIAARIKRACALLGSSGSATDQLFLQM